MRDYVEFISCYKRALKDVNQEEMNTKRVNMRLSFYREATNSDEIRELMDKHFKGFNNYKDTIKIFEVFNDEQKEKLLSFYEKFGIMRSVSDCRMWLYKNIPRISTEEYRTILIFSGDNTVSENAVSNEEYHKFCNKYAITEDGLFFHRDSCIWDQIKPYCKEQSDYWRLTYLHKYTEEKSQSNKVYKTYYFVVTVASEIIGNVAKKGLFIRYTKEPNGMMYYTCDIDDLGIILTDYNEIGFNKFKNYSLN